MCPTCRSRCATRKAIKNLLDVVAAYPMPGVAKVFLLNRHFDLTQTEQLVEIRLDISSVVTLLDRGSSVAVEALRWPYMFKLFRVGGGPRGVDTDNPLACSL